MNAATSEATTVDDVARINAVADELNREAEDVLEYQVISRAISLLIV
jgi:hypothetical protein